MALVVSLAEENFYSRMKRIRNVFQLGNRLLDFLGYELMVEMVHCYQLLPEHGNELRRWKLGPEIWLMRSVEELRSSSRFAHGYALDWSSEIR
jgi:hypothetical protein